MLLQFINNTRKKLRRCPRRSCRKSVVVVELVNPRQTELREDLQNTRASHDRQEVVDRHVTIRIERITEFSVQLLKTIRNLASCQSAK